MPRLAVAVRINNNDYYLPLHEVMILRRLKASLLNLISLNL